MWNRVAAGALLFVVLGSYAVRAQEPLITPAPSQLSGTWDLDTSGDPSLPAERRVITVSPQSVEVVIYRAADARPPRLTYRLDGQHSVTEFGAGTATGRLMREPAALATETVYDINNSPITIREVLRINAQATEMTIDATLRVEHGYQGTLPVGESKPPNVSNSVLVFVKRH